VIGARHPGIWIDWGGPRRFEPFGDDVNGPWSGLQVKRSDFDRMLLARAREVGVDVRQPCAVTGLRRQRGAVWGVTTCTGLLGATIVIDASGAARRLGRALGIASPPYSRRLIARYGYVYGACPVRDDAPALVGDASGWTWTARVWPRTYQWMRVSFNKSQVADWLPDELQGLLPLRAVRAADVTWRMVAQGAGSGWFIAGDAAAVLDPTSSHGVLKAIMSGMVAGHLSAAVVRQQALAGEAALAYHRWLKEWFAADAARLRQFYWQLGLSTMPKAGGDHDG
jgi:flavin-dependent dehydrogenase